MRNMTAEMLELNPLFLDDNILDIIADTQAYNDVYVALEINVIANNTKEAVK